jgi:hypothetical protein
MSYSVNGVAPAPPVCTAATIARTAALHRRLRHFLIWP